LTNLPRRTRDNIGQYLTNRNESRGARLTSDLNRLLADSEDYGAVTDGIIQVAKRKGSQVYGPAYAQDIPIDDDLAEFLEVPPVKELLNRPAFRKAFKEMDTFAKNEGQPLQQIYANNGKVRDDLDVLDTRTADYIKDGIDRQIGQLETRPKTGRQIKILTDAKNQFLTYTDEVNPLYPQARAASANGFQLERALDDGTKVLRKDSKITATKINDLTDEQKDIFRVGAAKSIRDDILSAPDGTDAYKRIFNNPLKTEKVRAAFPDEPSFNEFKQSMLREQVFDQTLKAFKIPRKDFTPTRSPLPQTTSSWNLKAKVVNGVINRAIKYFNAPREDVAEEVVKILLEPGFNKEATRSALLNLSNNGSKRVKPVADLAFSLYSGMAAPSGDE
jgi:hypothetical protein